ncbi:BQ2448_7865 [Microbotryum intermedium]|uniref:BQ2448_7865 protein n=1 Tax=Microbotryum intermedium TaxID=269621 RepID=A0A238FUU9_9BASI|nr:BQ2448_7865 [Microbotryum intermedium]
MLLVRLEPTVRRGGLGRCDRSAMTDPYLDLAPPTKTKKNKNKNKKRRKCTREDVSTPANIARGLPAPASWNTLNLNARPTPTTTTKTAHKGQHKRWSKQDRPRFAMAHKFVPSQAWIAQQEQQLAPLAPQQVEHEIASSPHPAAAAAMTTASTSTTILDEPITPLEPPSVAPLEPVHDHQHLDESSDDELVRQTLIPNPITTESSRSPTQEPQVPNPNQPGSEDMDMDSDEGASRPDSQSATDDDSSRSPTPESEPTIIVDPKHHPESNDDVDDDLPHHSPSPSSDEDSDQELFIYDPRDGTHSHLDPVSARSRRFQEVIDLVDVSDGESYLYDSSDEDDHDDEMIIVEQPLTEATPATVPGPDSNDPSASTSAAFTFLPPTIDAPLSARARGKRPLNPSIDTELEHVKRAARDPPPTFTSQDTPVVSAFAPTFTFQPLPTRPAVGFLATPRRPVPAPFLDLSSPAPASPALAPNPLPLHHRLTVIRRARSASAVPVDLPKPPSEREEGEVATSPARPPVPNTAIDHETGILINPTTGKGVYIRSRPSVGPNTPTGIGASRLKSLQRQLRSSNPVPSSPSTTSAPPPSLHRTAFDRRLSAHRKLRKWFPAEVGSVLQEAFFRPSACMVLSIEALDQVRPYEAIEYGFWPGATPTTTMMPCVTSSSFPSDSTPTSTTAGGLNLRPRVDIFIDNSNVIHSFNRWLGQTFPPKDRSLYSRLLRRVPEEVIDGTRYFLDYDILFALLERGMGSRVRKRVLVGSSKLRQGVEDAVRWGYEVSILQRVPRRSVLQSDPDGPITTLQKEQGVDELLHLKILEAILEHQTELTTPHQPPPNSNPPSTTFSPITSPRPLMLLVSGDAKSSEYNPSGFLGCIRKALSLNWDVEIWAFKKSTNRLWHELRNEQVRKRTGSGSGGGEHVWGNGDVRLVDLSTWAGELITR